MVFNAKKTRIGSFFSSSSRILFALAAFGSLLPTIASGEKVQLSPRKHAGSFSRVKTVVALAGSLNVQNPKATNEKKAAKKSGKTKASGESPEVQIPLKVDAEMFFDELGLQGDSFPTIRHYWDAKADFEVNEKAKDHRELRSERQLILLSQGVTATARFTSPHGPLTRQEIELIDIASNGFPPERLLPNRTVEEEETWTHEDDVVAELLRISKVTNGELSSQITEVDTDQVTISINGKVAGEVDGVKTKFEVKGNMQFDRADRLVSWIALAVREQRDISFAAPGFHVVSKIRTAREAIDSSDALTPKITRSLSLAPTKGDLLLDFEPENVNYNLALDRRWHLVGHQKFATMLRMFEDGDLLATCKIDQLTKSVPGKHVTLDGFREDVEAALGKNAKQILSASQSVNGQSVRVLRVVASGAVGETPIRWIYYHLSNDDGQRLSFIFTLESSMMSRFDGVDEEMASSVQLLQPKDAELAAEPDDTKPEQVGKRKNPMRR